MTAASLFVISLPRSLSTLTYHAARRVLSLEEPVWTSDGEVLNNDRYAMYDGVPHDLGRKFTCPDAEAAIAERLWAFLDQTVRPSGFAYKDVVQPFVIARWLMSKGCALSVLRIRRDVAEVALSMLNMRWMYPARSPSGMPVQDVEAAFLRGLLDAEAALASVPAVDVEYDALVRDESALTDALHRLAPDRALSEIRYVDAEFRKNTETQLARRRSERYQLLVERLAELRGERISAGGQTAPATSG